AHDVEMKQPEKAAAKAESQRLRRLRLEGEGGIVQPQLLERVAQRLVLSRVRRIEPAEDHRLHRLETGKRLGRRPRRFRDGVANAGIADFLDAGHEKSDVAGPDLGDL